MKLPLIAFVLDTEKRKTKNDKPFWQAMLKTANYGVVKSMQFDALEDMETNPKYPHKGELIEIYSLVDDLAEHGNVKLGNFDRTTKEKIPKEDLAIFDAEKVSPEVMKAASDLIFDSSFWEDKKHYKFAMQCLKSVDQEKLIKCPSGQSVHHNKEGGNWEHTAEVLKLCIGCVQSGVCNFLTPDVLYCGSILHDLGKIFTYSFDAIGNPVQLLEDRTLGHTFVSMHIVQSVHEKLKIVSDEFIHEVLHCIAAHHEKKEWGAISSPQSLEAEILCRMDYISSKNGMIKNSLKAIPGQLPEVVGMRGNEYFISTGIKNTMEPSK